MWQWQVGTADNPISDQGTSTAADSQSTDQGTSTAAYRNMIDTQPNVRSTIGRVTMRYEKCEIADLPNCNTRAHIVPVLYIGFIAYTQQHPPHLFVQQLWCT